MRKPLLIPSQVPDFLRSEYPAFVEFLQLYYEWLEQQQIGSIESLVDIDKTVDDFIRYFRSEFDVNGIQYEFISPRLFLRKSKELFTAKGSEAAIKFLFRILYGKESDVITPWDYVLIPSEGKWFQDLTIFAQINVGNGDDLTAQRITFTGTDGRGYSTFVRAAAKITDNVYQLYLDQFNTTNVTFDVTFVNENNTIQGAVLRTTSNAKVVDGGYDFEVGQLFTIVGFSGSGTIVKVKAVNENGTITAVEIIQFGLGYNTNFTTQIYPTDSIAPQNVAQITLTYDQDSDSNPDLVATYTTNDKLKNPSEALLFTKHNYTGTAGSRWIVDIDKIVPTAEYKVVSFGSTDYSKFTQIGVSGASLGVEYKILTVGTTDFAQLTRISAKQIISGIEYKILTVGTTDFTEFGAANNNIGTTFIASQNGDIDSGTGEVGRVLDIGDTFTATVSGSISFGTGTIGIPITSVGQIFTATVSGLDEDSKEIESISYNSGTVTVECTNHGYSIGDSVKILNVSPAGYNGKFTITDADLNSFEYALVEDPGTYISGGEIVSSGTIETLRSFFTDSTYVGQIVGETQVQQNYPIVTRLGAATLLFQVGGIAKYPGYYLDGESLISDLSYVQDSFRYQKFSYVTAIEEELETYKQLLKKTLHPIGTQLLGEYRVSNDFTQTVNVDPQLNVIPRGSFVDIVTSSDDITTFAIGKNVYDPIDTIVTDAYITSFEIGKALTEIATTSTTTIFDVTKVLSDVATTADDIAAIDVTKVLSDNIDTDDTNIEFVVDKALSDSATIAENATFEIDKSLTDTGTVTDAASITTNKYITDSVIVTDQITDAEYSGGRTIFQTVNTTDNAVIATDKYLTDTANTSNAGGLFVGPLYYDVTEAQYWAAGYLENETAITN